MTPAPLGVSASPPSIAPQTRLLPTSANNLPYIARPIFNCFIISSRCNPWELGTVSKTCFTAKANFRWLGDSRRMFLHILRFLAAATSPRSSQATIASTLPYLMPRPLPSRCAYSEAPQTRRTTIDNLFVFHFAPLLGRTPLHGANKIKHCDTSREKCPNHRGKVIT